MSAGKYDINIDQGATWSITLTIKQANRLPLNLTGYTGEGMIKKTVDDPTPIASFIVSFPSPLEGKVSLLIPADVTSTMDFVWGVYDFKITSPEAQVTRILQGKVTLNKEVSREIEVIPDE